MKEEQKQEPDNILRVVTIRDYFAAMALQATVSNADTMREITAAYERGNRKDSFTYCVAELAYDYADSMIEQRTK